VAKLAPKDVARWLCQPVTVAAVLVHGEDRGAVAEIAAQIGRAFVPDLADPFAVTLLETDSLRQDPARLADELGMLPPLGGARLVRLRDATDRHAELIEAGLNLKDVPPRGQLLLLEAGELLYRSTLRKLFESHPRLASIHCGAETTASLEGFLRQALAAEQLSIGADALAVLAQRLGPDRALARQAVESLVLYKTGDSDRTVSAREVRAVVGEAELWAFDAVIDALLSGQRGAIDRALAQAFAGGTAAVGLLRAALRSLQRLHLMSSLMARGMNAEAALATLLPPVPYTARPLMTTAAKRWSPAVLSQILVMLEDAEIHCKTTGIPEASACAQVLLTLPGLAAARPLKRA
jgi:DNA polymerase-3 subunit delta